MKRFFSFLLISSILFTILPVEIISVFATESNIMVTVQGTSGQPGETVKAYVCISDGAISNVCSGSFELTYDNSKLKVISATAGETILGTMAIVNKDFAANKIKATWASVSPFTKSGQLLEVKFEILNETAGNAVLNLEKLKLSDSSANLIEPIDITDGLIEIVQHVHNWGSRSITTEPTKTTVGEAKRICNDDSSHIDIEEIPILTDTTVWTKGEYVAPTCENTGSQEYTSIYGTVTETIPATGHSWGTWRITTEPTKTETGSAERVCSNDNNHEDNKTLPILTDASIWTKGEYVAPTCENTGSQEYTSIYGTVTETIPATGHSWGAWSITTEPTKTKTGSAERICGNDSTHKDTMTLPKLTDNAVWTIGAYVAPTCENTGSQEYTSIYGTVTETIPATGHSWGAWSITTEPTKTETGSAERICDNDSTHKDTMTLPKLIENTVWTIGEYVAPTCENIGSQEYTSIYGTVTETISATGHNWGAWNITTEPTKTETGSAERICDNDSTHKDTMTLPKLIDNTVWIIGEYVAPTCENTGSQEYTSIYGNVIETITATGHSWGAWSITTEPTKTETGVAERICGNDSTHKDTITLPKLTDNAVWTIGTYVAPTCENMGSQEYTSIYGTVTETIPETGHSWGVWSITTEPTKTETGAAERVCGNDSNHKDSKTLPVLTDASVWTIGEYIAPTCENTGSQEYTSIYGTVTEIIPATGHSWGAWNIITEPTKTETGTAEKICGNDSTHKDTMTLPKLTDNTVWTIGTYVAPTCENTGSQEYTSIYGTVTETISATGHSWGAWSITTEPTKTETGSAERICDNDSTHKDTMTLPKLTDNTVWTIGEYVAPTCENTGSQEYTSIYGTVTETIPATGHSWGEWNITTEPTKTETGSAERICGNDSTHKDTMTLPKLIDNTVWTIGTYVAPTCENMGSQDYTSIYGMVTETIPATGHSWGAWNITTEPTKTETGSAERVCGNDSSHKDNKTLPILTDTSIWTEGEYVAPTCTEEGAQKYLSEYGIIIESLAVLGHNYEWIITKQPTEEETGLKHEECSRCHDKKNETEIEKLPKTKFTITFDLNGGNNVSSETLLTGSDGKLPDLPIASRAGNYRFEGWFTESTGGNKISVDTVFITDTTVYAHWTYTGGGSLSVTNYTVTFNTMGGSNIDSVRVKQNTIIQKPSDPIKDGYNFAGWYSDKNLTDKFDFDTKITKSITLYAKWAEKEQPDKQVIIEPIHTGVAKLLETEKHIKYMVGYDNSTFKPENNMTRAEAAQMFYNLLLKKDVSGNNTFDDVSADVWYYDAVSKLSNMGIIKGKSDRMFDPNGEITRAEFTTIAMRFTNIDINGTDNFTDVPSSHWASKDIADAVSLGWISGNGDGTFSPDRPITRASVSRIVNNMLGRKADIDYINNYNNSITLFSDVPVSAWYYADVVEATNTHEYDNNSGTEIWK